MEEVVQLSKFTKKKKKEMNCMFKINVFYGT